MVKDSTERFISRAVMCTSDWADHGRVHCRWLTWRLRVAYLQYNQHTSIQRRLFVDHHHRQPPPHEHLDTSAEHSHFEKHQHEWEAAHTAKELIVLTRTVTSEHEQIRRAIQTHR